MSKKITQLAILLSVLGLTACETVKGAGRDVSTAGDVITETAEDVQEDI